MTATEWLIQQLLAVGRLEIQKNDYILTIIDQAKEIEKIQIIDAHFTAQMEDLQFWNEAKQEALDYYNETFKNTNK